MNLPLSHRHHRPETTADRKLGHAWCRQRNGARFGRCPIKRHCVKKSGCRPRSLFSPSVGRRRFRSRHVTRLRLAWLSLCVLPLLRRLCMCYAARPKVARFRLLFFSRCVVQVTCAARATRCVLRNDRTPSSIRESRCVQLVSFVMSRFAESLHGILRISRDTWLRK